MCIEEMLYIRMNKVYRDCRRVGNIKWDFFPSYTASITLGNRDFVFSYGDIASCKYLLTESGATVTYASENNPLGGYIYMERKGSLYRLIRRTFFRRNYSLYKDEKKCGQIGSGEWSSLNTFWSSRRLACLTRLPYFFTVRVKSPDGKSVRIYLKAANGSTFGIRINKGMII